MRHVIWVLVAVGLSGCVSPAVEGRRDFQAYCVSCHGDSGTGNGLAASGLARKPADLTTLSQRNDGKFPAVYVMSTIDGYSRRIHGDMTMPEFGPLLEEGKLVMLQTEPGIFIPTPERLVALAANIETLQK